MSTMSQATPARKTRPTVYIFVALGALVGLALAISHEVVDIKSPLYCGRGVVHDHDEITVDVFGHRIFQRQMTYDAARVARLCFETWSAVTLACLGAAGGLAFAERQAIESFFCRGERFE